MTNIGRFVDRHPNIRPAGVTSKLDPPVAESLKFYSVEEAAEAIIRAQCRLYENQQNNNLARRTPYLPEENVKDILTTELRKSRFLAFREKFQEDMYFKKSELGKVFPLHSKPDHITNETTTFGIKRKTSENVYDLIFPHKTPEEVRREYTNWHDKYIISHQDYFPSERINRLYDRKTFNPEATFGIAQNADLTGKFVKRCLSQCNNLIIISKPQKDFLEKHMGRLGKNINRIDPKIALHRTFGKRTQRDICDCKSLLENIDPCESNVKLIEAFAHLNSMRRTLFERGYHMNDLKAALERRITDGTKSLPLSIVFEVARLQYIHLNEEKIRTALYHFKLINSPDNSQQCVEIERFWKLLHIQFPLPATGSITKMPDSVYNKDTTYRLLCRDRDKPIKETPVAKRVQHNVEEPTSAKDVITPDIPMHFGLAPSDFERPYSKEMLRRIFRRVLTDRFDEVWEQARESLKLGDNDLMSIQQLRGAMNVKSIVEEEH